MSKVHTLKTEQQADVWQTLRQEAEKLATQDAALAPLLQTVILQARDLPEALGHLLSEKLAAKHLPEGLLLQLFAEFFSAVPDFADTLERDISSIMTHDPAARDTVCPFLFFKGFHALESYRLAHYLWSVDRQHLALYLQNRISDLFGVDIHPAARIGRGVMMDHATGIVVGETAVIEDDVLLWHSVTLGGRKMAPGDRHPKVRKGAVLGANSTLLGNIEIGEGAKVAAGSVVVADVPAGATVAGTPAKIV
jgi:serine O-acetyltransferase